MNLLLLRFRLILVSKVIRTSLTWFLFLFFIAPQAFAQTIMLTATPGQDKVDLSWTEISGASGYDLYFCEDTTSTACTVATSGGANPPYLGWITSGTTYAHTGLTPGTTYRYQVTHYVGGTTRSDVVAATTPGGPSLTAGSINATTATLTLGGHTGNWHYKETAPSSGACSAVQTGASVNLTGLTAGTSYTYKAYSDSSCTTELASVTFSTTALQFTLTATPGQGKVDLSWAEISGAAGYDLYFCEDTTSTACTVATSGGANPPYLGWITSGTTYAHTGLTPGTTYRYQVTHYVGGTTRSDVVAVTTPGGPSSTAGSINATTATLTLGGHTGNWHYKQTAPSSGACSAVQTTTSVTLTGLAASTEYTYKAYSDSGCSTELASVTFTTTPEFEASFESGHQWFRRDVIPALSGNTTWNSIAWKGERIQQHILVNNVPSNSQVSLVSSDLTTAANDTIPAGAVSFRYPRFVAGQTEVRSCSRDYQQDNGTAYLSDALFSAPTQALPASWPELVWMSVDIPPDAATGEYSGTVTVTAVSGETSTAMTTLQVSVQVSPWTLPADADRQFHLDLWQFPVSVLDRYNDANPSNRITIWSEQHYALLEPTYRYLAGLGQRTVTTYIKEGALGAPSMIQWTLKSDDSWEYDYSVFDAYVTRLAGWGLDEQISAFSPIGWNERDIPYWDEANTRKATFSADVGSADWNARWRHFLTDFKAHLVAQGWLDKTVLYLDESTEEDAQAVIDLVRDIDENWKIGLAYTGYGSDGPGEQVLSKLYDDSSLMVLVGTTYVDTGLAAGETYRYAVDAVNDSASDASSPVTVVAQVPAVPGQPTGLTAQNVSGGIQLSWTAPSATGSSALTGYNVYRCVDGGSSCAPVWFDSVTSGATYTDSYVAANTTYRYTVEACNGSGCGDRAGEITLMTGDTANEQPVGSDDMAEPDQTPQHQAVPAVPTNLTAFAASATAIQLSWEGSAVKGFNVYRCVGSQTCDPVTYRAWTYADNYTPDPDRISTFYTSCVQPRPNSFVAAAGNPVDVAALPWHALQRRQDGYLRWAFDNWRSSEPLDVREGTFTAGDYSFVYRSGNDSDMTVVPSIRSELLRDGIEDFEKVQVLRNRLAACAENDLAGRWLERLERTVDSFSAAPLMAGRAGDLISQAHDRLGEISVQLTPDMCR